MGEVTQEPTFSHYYNKEAFDTFSIAIKRTSGVLDYIPCIISHDMLPNISERDFVHITGSIRSYAVNGHCLTYAYVTGIHSSDKDKYKNEVVIDGFLVKKDEVRQTPLGRQLIDITFATNREYVRRSDYLHCITWGRSANRMENIEIGERIEATGKFQSRFYLKKLENDSTEERIAYEISLRSYGRKLNEDKRDTDN